MVTFERGPFKSEKSHQNNRNICFTYNSSPNIAAQITFKTHI